MIVYINTRSGSEIPCDISIYSLATSLSKVCRYAGRIEEFYSVAEHSVILAKMVYNLTGCRSQALTALLHDGSEARLGDVTRDIKSEIEGYKYLEDQLTNKINEYYGVAPMDEFIHHLDYNIVYDEALVLFEEFPEWATKYEPIGAKVEILTHREAKDAFLSMYEFLTEGVSV